MREPTTARIVRPCPSCSDFLIRRGRRRRAGRSRRAAIAYEKQLYQPLLGELGLRRKLGKWTGIVSVPVLTDDDGRVIPTRPTSRGGRMVAAPGRRCFRRAARPRSSGSSRCRIGGMAAGRTLSLLRLLDDDEGIGEMVPRGLRKLPGARAIAKAGVARTLRKYRGMRDQDAARTALGAVLDEVRAALAKAPTGTREDAARAVHVRRCRGRAGARVRRAAGVRVEARRRDAKELLRRRAARAVRGSRRMARRAGQAHRPRQA